MIFSSVVAAAAPTARTASGIETHVYSGSCYNRPGDDSTITTSETPMAIADLTSVLKIFGGGDVSEAEQQELFKEVLLMTLARAADADINIQHAEVDRIREILREHTGEEFSASDIRVAARDELYAQATLKKYLESVRSKMSDRQRGETVTALADVLRSDSNVSVLEVDFFNTVAKALRVTPAELAGLYAGDID